ncbi:MAG: hypothetical protein ABI696_10450 [Rubrivivax sp.]
MKRYFGSFLLRRLRGGVVLRREEHQVVSSMIAELPDHLRATVESQFNQSNLVQRESDGRALNFYRMGLFRTKPLSPRTRLPGGAGDSPLIRVSVSVPGEEHPLRATLSAVAGKAFCASFSRPLPDTDSERPLRITEVVPAWMASFPAG